MVCCFVFGLHAELGQETGCISGNCVNGQGTLTSADGSQYVGEFRDELPDGKGTFTFADGNKYVGEFRDGEWVEKKQMTPSQIAEAQTLARECVKKNYKGC